MHFYGTELISLKVGIFHCYLFLSSAWIEWKLFWGEKIKVSNKKQIFLKQIRTKSLYENH